MSPHHEGIFIICLVLHMICIIPTTSTNHIHHSSFRAENFHSTNRGECLAWQTKKREKFAAESTNILQRFSNEWNQSIIDSEREC